MRKTIFFCVFVLLTMAWNACSGEGNAIESDDKIVKTKPVKTVILKPQSFSNYLNLTGTVIARNHVSIIVEEAGTLSKVRKDKGHYARSGEVLATLDNAVLKAQYEQAEAAQRQAELSHSSRKVLYEKRAISENEYLNARYALDAAQAAFNLARARVDKLTIRAPLNGIINERYYDIGAYANPMTPIFEFIDNAVMKIRVGVAERFMSDVKVGSPVEITFDAYPDMKLNAAVTFVSRSIDPQNRTFIVEIQVANTDGDLAPQMIANVRVLRESLENRIVVPLDALVESEKGWYVFLRDGDQARRVAVQQQAIYQNKVLVDGLKAGQELIVVGQRDLSNEDPIKVVE